jgi:D-arabinose 1-dehydrogenase-like Zn-dependent alcohol dehydrogenase
MKAAVIEQFGEPLKVHSDWSDPQCGPRDAIIGVVACGICRSDYTLWQGGMEWVGIVPALPAVLGHEYCGVVEEVGSEVTGFRKGDRVVSPFCHACGTCELCAEGHQNVCADLQIPSMHYTGGYAGHTKVANADVNLVSLPAAISFPEAAGMGCRFVTSYHGVVDQAAVKAGEWVAVFACGGVGLAAVNIASALGANVIAVSRSEGKLDLARNLGAVHTVTAGPDAPGEIVELTGGGVHVSVDALGAAETAIPAIMSLRTRGRHLRLGGSNKKEQGQISLPVDVILFRELSVVGSFGMQAARFPEMLGMVEAGKLNPGLLVGDKVDLEDAGEVLASMAGYDTLAMSVITRF